MKRALVFRCTNRTFGGDPAHGTRKACYNGSKRLAWEGKSGTFVKCRGGNPPGGTGGSTPAPKSDDYYAKKYGTIAVAAYNKTKAKGCSTPGNIYGGAKHSDHYNWAKREIKSRGLSGANKKFAGEHGKRANHYKSCKPSGGGNKEVCRREMQNLRAEAGLINKGGSKVKGAIRNIAIIGARYNKAGCK